MGQNERTANYGTSVESCSDNSRSAPAVKLRISPSAAYNDRKGILPKNVDNFFEKMGVKKRLAMQTAQKNIYLTYVLYYNGNQNANGYMDMSCDKNGNITKHYPWS